MMLQLKNHEITNNHFPQLQPKLKIGQPGDKYEQEADAVADKVMRMSQSGSIQMQPMEEEEEMLQPELRMQVEEEDEDPIQMKCAQCENEKFVQATTQPGGLNATSEITSQLNASKGSGQILPEKTNQQMSHAIGADFSRVKIHTSRNAIQMNKRLNARAFTHGSDIYFNRGEYNPSASKGKRLLAHELTHVVQQGAAAGQQLISRAPDQTGPVVALPQSERDELKRLTGNRLDRSASYYNDALLEVKIKVGNMLKEQKAAADAMFELAFGLLMPGLGKLVGRGLAAVAATLPANASTASYRAALALLDADRTKEVFNKAVDIGQKASKIDLNSRLKSITGDTNIELFFTALEKSAAAGFDKLDSELSNKSDRELGVLYMSYDPVETSSSDYVKVIEELYLMFKEQISPIGEKTYGAYGLKKARWIEGTKWKALALTGEGRYYNVGAGTEFITWISPQMKNAAIEATLAITKRPIDIVHYGTVQGPITAGGFKYILDSDFPMTDNDVAIEKSSGTARKPSRGVCPSCHGETGPRSYPPGEPAFEIPDWEPLLKQPPPTSLSASEIQTVLEWIESTPEK